MSNRSHSTLDLIATALPFLWIGLVLGVSFLATPAKFQVENLDGAQSLAISVVTFLWLHIAETVAAALVTLLLILTKARWMAWVLLAVAVIALVLQADWILPAFEGRAGFIPLLPALDFQQLHTVFAATEGSKILALIALGYIAFRGRSAMPDASADEAQADTI